MKRELLGCLMLLSIATLAIACIDHTEPMPKIKVVNSDIPTEQELAAIVELVESGKFVEIPE